MDYSINNRMRSFARMDSVSPMRHQSNQRNDNFNTRLQSSNHYTPSFNTGMEKLAGQQLSHFSPSSSNSYESRYGWHGSSEHYGSRGHHHYHHGNHWISRGSRFHSIDGSGNNRFQPELGSAKRPVERVLAPDSSREPGGSTEARLSSAREISNAVSSQSGNTENRKGLSDMFWLWGQFLDHDITLIEGHAGNPKANIVVPKGDPQFDPKGTGNVTLDFTRSDSFIDSWGEKRHTNDLTAFIDGSNVYGSDKETADNLRSFSGGRLRVDADNLLPRDERGHFQAGDIRANENVGLTSMHTIWAREHNRIADKISDNRPWLSDQKVFQKARRQVVAQIQAITYNEFLPNLLGENALSPYGGYDPRQSPQMSQAFSTSAFRFGHTMLSPNVLRLGEDGQEIEQGNLSLRDAFFQPQRVTEAGIDPILRGFASQTAQAADPMIVDDVRNFLFGRPGAGGLDLAALNIQRGRDHGLPGYNDARTQMGLPRIESFDDPIWKDGVGAKLAQVYDSPDDVDLWVAGLAENHVGDSLLGETNTEILTEQFEALRNSDRFWYENQFSPRKVRRLNRLSLADVIQRNSDVQNIQDNVMVASNVHKSASVESTVPQADSMFGQQGFSAAPIASTQGNTVEPQQSQSASQEQPLPQDAVSELRRAAEAGRLSF